MLRVRHLAVPWASVCVLLLAGLACDDSTDSGETLDAIGASDDTQSASSVPAATSGDPYGGSGAAPLWKAESLESLLSWYPHAIVGTVQDLVNVEQRVYDTDNAVFDAPPASVYSVKVHQVVSSSRVRPDTVLIYKQAGGPGKDGTLIWIDELPKVGATYLFFLQDLAEINEPDHYTGPPFARFPIDESGRVVPTGSEAAPGVRAVSGVSPEEMAGFPSGPDGEQALRSLARVHVDDAAKVIQEAAARSTPMPPPAAESPPPPASPVPVDTATPAASPAP